MSYFQDKVVWITGATSGIGEELAYQLSAEGAKLVLSSRRIEELERVKSKCNSSDILLLPLDLQNSGNFDELTNSVIEAFGSIDYLFNNGGVSQRAQASETSLETDRKIMEINFFGNIALSKSVLPKMIKQGHGHIIVTSSVAGKFGFFLRSSYSASKHALHGFYETLRLENLKNNIQVTMLVPGAVNTNMSVNAMSGDGSKHGKQDRMQNQGMPVDKCVRAILKAVKRKKEELIFGGRETIPIRIKRFLPGLFTKIMAKQNPTG